MVADLASVRENAEIGEFTIVGRGVTVKIRFASASAVSWRPKLI